MRIRQLKESDLGQVFDLFSSVSVTKRQVEANPVPKSGFYEYHLQEQDMKKRLDPSFSLALEDKGRIVAYLIAYQLSRFHDLKQMNDPVLERLAMADPKTVYVDQLFLSPGLPAYLAGRMVNVWDSQLPVGEVPMVTTAIPQKPWKNEASTRFAICRGYKRQSTVSSEGIELGLFTKPILSKDREFKL